MLLGLGFAEGTGAPPSCDAGGLSAARLLKTGGGLGVPGWWEGYLTENCGLTEIADPGMVRSET